jgi:enoyl-CoA hydratase
MELTQLKFAQEENLGIITISRPEALNALNSNFFYEFNLLLDNIEREKSIRVLIITGEGKAFVAGADIAEMKGMKEKDGYEFSLLGQDTFSRLENMDIVVMAAVNGFALGGGCELAMACDFRIASSKAKFGMPEVSLGLIPGYGGTQRLSRLVGLGNALYYTLSGQIFDAHEALRVGLIQRLSDTEFLIDEAKELAKNIIDKGPNAVKAAKKVIRSGFKRDINTGFEIERDWFSKQFEGDGIEGMSAFLEKRKAEWGK